MKPSAGRRSALDGPAARVVALACFAAAAGLLGYLHREYVLPAEPTAAAKDDGFAACLAERGSQVDKMLADGVIRKSQADQFQGRAEALCRDLADRGRLTQGGRPR